MRRRQESTPVAVYQSVPFKMTCPETKKWGGGGVGHRLGVYPGCQVEVRVPQKYAHYMPRKSSTTDGGVRI